MDLESAFNWLIVLRLWVKLSRVVVAGDENLPRANLAKDVALALCCEGVVVSPYL